MNMMHVASEVTDDENLKHENPKKLKTISEKEELISKAHSVIQLVKSNTNS